MAEAPKTPPAPDQNPPPAQSPVRAMSPDEIRQAQAADQQRINAEVAERNATEVEPGGRYKVGDDLVDADGKPIKDKKS